MSNINKVKVKVTYKSEDGIDEVVDKKIQKVINGAGGVWYAQGIDLINGERDICFDLEI